VRFRSSDILKIKTPNSNLTLVIQRHSQKNGAKESIDQELIDIKQYFELFDLINDKSLVLSKDANTKLSQSFAMVKTIFMSQSKANFSFHFETILSRLPLNESDKQKEVNKNRPAKSHIQSCQFFMISRF
jgi:hypothetical protein